MEKLTPLEICVVVFGALLSLAGIVNTIGSAVEKIAKAKKAINAPNEAQNDRLDNLETRMATVERKLENDHKEIRDFRESSRINALALIALLDHSLDGNNIKQMQEAKNELNHWLASK